MTATQLRENGVTGKHFRQLHQLREGNTFEVTRKELDLEKFGRSLRSLREDANIGLREMARLLDLSASFLSDCELGHRKLGPSHCLLFIKYCAA